ncbi:hypothetical protein pb186bvf_006520 [Paramecium bursaria]
MWNKLFNKKEKKVSQKSDITIEQARQLISNAVYNSMLDLIFRDDKNNQINSKISFNNDLKLKSCVIQNGIIELIQNDEDWEDDDDYDSRIYEQYEDEIQQQMEREIQEDMYEEYEKTDIKFNHISQDEDWEDVE